jgi:hypothetical protein
MSDTDLRERPAARRWAPSVLSAPAWWTDVDQAELDVLVYALVRAGFAHRDCDRCRALNTWCPPMAEAAEAVFDWLRFRRLLSRAQFLRVLEERRAA